MKASEITQPGFYWYRKAGDPVVVEACLDDGRVEFYFAGNEEWSYAADLPGEFVGPLEPPQSQGTFP